MEVAEAVKLFEKALQLDPEFAMAYARIGYSYGVSQIFLDRAKPYLQKAFELSSRLTDKDRTFIAAWNAIAHLDYQQAIVHLKGIVSRYPLEVEAYSRLGLLLLTENEPDEARDMLMRGLTVDPESKHLLNTLGKVYQLQARHEEAIAAHRRYVTLAPKEPNSYDSLGLSLQYAGRYDEAIAAYLRALELNPKFEIAAVHLGNTYYQLGRMNAAIEEYRRYIQIADYDSDRARGRLAIAWTQFKLGREEEAWRRVHQETREHSASLERAIVALTRGDLAITEDVIKSMKLRDRGRRASRRPLEFVTGELLLAQGRTEEALERFKATLTELPLTFAMETFDDCLASALLRVGRYAEAEKEFNRLLTINPNAGRVRFGLAQTFDRSGRPAEARAEYERMIALWKDADPDVPELLAAKARLAALVTAVSSSSPRPLP
jgi:superkiller protein 3